MVGFPLGFATDGHCLVCGIVKPSFKTLEAISQLLLLARSRATFLLGAQCDCKAGTGGRCRHVAALLYNIVDYVGLGLAIIPEDKTCTDTPQQWNGQEISQVIVQFCFRKYSLCTIHAET